MNEPTPVGALIEFPADRAADSQSPPERPQRAVDGAGGGNGGRPPVPPAADSPDEGDDEVLQGTVLVDAAAGGRDDARTRFIQAMEAQRRPIIAAWLRNIDDAKATARWAAGYAGHVVAFHVVRIPVYGARLAFRSPRGACRVVAAAWRWTFDAEAMPLRMSAVDHDDADTYLRLLRERDNRVRWRRMLALSGVVGTVMAAGAVASAGAVTQAGALLAGVAVLGWIGAPADKPLIGPAVVSSKPPKLTSDVIVRALQSLGISEINKSARDGGGITFPAPITRDGPGFRADVDLPFGVTPGDVMERRAKLASGLRRPVGCVWPEPADEEHAGRLVLWVGDKPMAQTRQPRWPLATAGKVDVFEPAPFGTDQRGRFVKVTLMFVSVIIGAIPRMGKTFILRLLLLICALDPREEIHAYDLKGTGDLSALEPVAHAYRAGDEEEDIAYALVDMRGLRAELRRRTKVIRNLPKEECPENKVTPELASRRSLGLHPITIGVDECQVWFEHPKHGAEFEEICTDLVKRGPALGMKLILATQRPDAKSLPSPISANAGMRICLKVMDHTANDMVLGTSAHKTGVRATMFSLKDKGICYLVGEGENAQIVRSVFVDAPAAEAIALRARAMRKAAGTLTGYATGEDIEPEQRDQATVLADILSITTDAEDKIRSHVVVDRLAELRPNVYGPWADQRAEAPEAERRTAKATALAAALRPYGIKTVQINRRTETGEQDNSKGIVRADIEAAYERTRAADD